MNESACSIPAKRSRTEGAASAAPPYAPSTCIHTPCSLQTAAMPVRSSIAPRFVVPAVAATAKSPSAPSRSIVAARPSPVIRPRPSGATSRSSTSITAAAVATDECVSSVHATRSGAPLRPPFAARWVWRAATSAERFPIVPPCTKQPAAVSGSSARPASHSSAWFSA